MKNNFEINKTTRNILYVASAIIILPLAFLLYRVGSKAPSGNEAILIEASAMSFNGRVDSIYYDKENHNIETLILSDGFRYQLFRRWSSLVNLGDSLFKKKGDLKVEVIKRNHNKIFLDYNILIKDFR